MVPQRVAHLHAAAGEMGVAQPRCWARVNTPHPQQRSRPHRQLQRSCRERPLARNTGAPFCAQRLAAVRCVNPGTGRRRSVTCAAVSSRCRMGGAPPAVSFAARVEFVDKPSHGRICEGPHTRLTRQVELQPAPHPGCTSPHIQGAPAHRIEGTAPTTTGAYAIFPRSPAGVAALAPQGLGPKSTHSDISAPSRGKASE